MILIISHEMEQDTSHFSLPDSVNDLLSLQNGAAGVTEAEAASSQVLSQGDLEALASIQEELDRMGSAEAGHGNFVEGRCFCGLGGLC